MCEFINMSIGFHNNIMSYMYVPTYNTYIILSLYTKYQIYYCYCILIIIYVDIHTKYSCVKDDKGHILHD